MIDDGIVSTAVQLGSRSAQGSFYAVQGLQYGILGMNLLSSFQVQIDVAEQKLLVEVVTLRRMPPASAVCLLKFGRVYFPTDIDVPANSELIIWGKVRSDESENWIGMVEITEELADRSGLLGCATVVTCGQDKRIPVRVLNILSDPIRVRKGQSLADCIEASVVADAVNKIEDADADGHVSVTSGVTIGAGFSAVDKQRVDTLLDKYRDVFASPGNTCCCTIVEHTIPLTTDQPITCRPLLDNT